MKCFLLLLMLVAGCTAQAPLLPEAVRVPKMPTGESKSAIEADSAPAGTRVSETPRPPPPVGSATQAPPAAPRPQEEANITLAFDQIPLPSFIQVIYGQTLKKTVNLDPAVAARQDLVTIRTGQPQTPSQIADTARLLLKSYGIAVIDLGTLVRVVPDTAAVGYLPEIRRGRALPDTPLPLRPIFHLVELQAVRNTDIAAWLKTMFGNKVNVQEDAPRNSVLLSGLPEDIAAALEAIRVLDQPMMRGRNSARITPAFLSAEELTRKLIELLQAEGYSAGLPGAVSFPITLVPIPAVNSIVVFGGDPAIVSHVVAWARDLDRPDTRGIGRTIFSYQVQYTDAQVLAATLEKVLSGSPARAIASAPGTAPGAAAPATIPSRVVVDPSSNTIIFQGTAEDYGQVRSLLEMLDRQTKQALIEVTVAEVRLNDDLQLGVEWLIRKLDLTGISQVYGTLGGLGIGTAGFNYSRIDTPGGRTLVLNALASDNRATILSSPRIVARNGETATIQVGQEVPIITSQQTSPTTGSSGSLIQTVQYKTTGVILKVRPVIHSGNQVDLEVAQEVSAAQSTTTGVNTSPTFGTRKVETKLTLREGSTVLLGGLISSNANQGAAGIPLLKDIPIVGQAFRTNNSTRDRTELIVLITPHIISNSNEAEAVTDAFRRQLGDPAWGTRSAPRHGSPNLDNALEHKK